MAELPDKIEIPVVFNEKFVKVLCRNFKCKFNLNWKREAACDLKNITIEEGGKCRQMELRDWHNH